MATQMKGLALSALVAATTLALVAACSGSDAPNAEATSTDNGVVPPAPGRDPTTPTTAPDGAVLPGLEDAGGDVTPPEKPNFIPEEDAGPQPEAALCAQDVVGFDLSQLSPALGSRAEVVTAWNEAKQLATRPPLVLLLNGAFYASPIKAMAGAVVPVSATEFQFAGAPLSTDWLPVDLDVSDKLRVIIPNAEGSFVGAFSDTTPNGFAASAIQVDGHVDGFCTQFSGTVTIIIPATDPPSAFGGSNLKAAFGPATIAIDGNIDPNAWSLTLTGTATNVSMRTQP